MLGRRLLSRVLLREVLWRILRGSRVGLRIMLGAMVRGCVRIVLWNMELQWPMALYHSLRCHNLGDCAKGLMLDVTGLEMVSITCTQGQIFALFILQTDFPA